MIPPLAIVDVAPVGTQTGPAFVCSSRFGEGMAAETEALDG